MLTNQQEVSFGYAEPYRNFIYIDDLLDAWVTVINNPDKVNGKIFTLGPDNPIKIKDYADLIAKKLNWNGKINWHTKLFRPGEIYWLNSNHNLITEVTGWSPKVSLDQGLDLTIDIWKEKIKC
jgi:nucleoside-diphosphate-sugar epimerase